MEDKLLALVDRLGKDIDGMPWLDKSLPPAQLKHSVEFFVRAWQNDAKKIIDEETDEYIKRTYDASGKMTSEETRSKITKGEEDAKKEND